MSARRLSSVLILAALGAALTAVGVLAVAQAPARTVADAPRLALRSLDPTTVHGTSFARRERVTVTVRGLPGGKQVRHRRASTRGSFTVTFPNAGAARCGGLTVRAKGNAGSRAMLKRLPLPACSPA
jgi:hypothetical protein